MWNAQPTQIACDYFFWKFVISCHILWFCPLDEWTSMHWISRMLLLNLQLRVVTWKYVKRKAYCSRQRGISNNTFILLLIILNCVSPKLKHGSSLSLLNNGSIASDYSILVVLKSSQWSTPTSIVTVLLPMLYIQRFQHVFCNHKNSISIRLI